MIKLIYVDARRLRQISKLERKITHKSDAERRKNHEKGS